MEIEIIKLKNSLVDSVDIDCDIKFHEEDIKNADMLDLSNVHVTGDITKTSLEEYNVFLNVTGTMVLPCSITLKPVDYPFNINIDEIFSENSNEISKKIKKFENSIDILPIVWENILMEIPMKVVSPDASFEKIEGNGWKLITEEQDNVNPELARLQELFEKKEV